jgi:hypothetical protein
MAEGVGGGERGERKRGEAKEADGAASPSQIALTSVSFFFSHESAVQDPKKSNHNN